MTTPFPDVFIVLTGGSGRRLGGLDKASIDVEGDSLFDRALRGAAGRPVVVVGPSRQTSSGVTFTREDPPGGGPAAGVAAGITAACRLRRTGAEPAGPDALAAVVAVDQVGVTAETWRRLAASATAGGAVLMSGGQREYGVGVFPLEALRAACETRTSWHGRRLGELMDPLVTAEVDAIGDESQDIDTLEDLHRWAARTGSRVVRGGTASAVNDKGDLR